MLVPKKALNSAGVLPCELYQNTSVCPGLDDPYFQEWEMLCPQDYHLYTHNERHSYLM